MDLSNVKSIVIPEGTVKKIEDGDGNVLWKKPVTTATINITIGASQDITTPQNYQRIVLPSLNSIKSKVASKIGASPSDVNVTKVQLNLSTLYWYNSYSDQRFPRFSLTTSNPSYFGDGTIRNSTGRNNWSSDKLDITDKLASYSTKSFYGYAWHAYTTEVNAFSSKSSSGSRFCTNSSSSTKPTFTIIVTYEY